jgi:SAM-dependent methyltransferase
VCTHTAAQAGWLWTGSVDGIDHDRATAVAEIYRVLRPGGTLLIGEFQTSRGRRWSRLHHFWAGETIEQARELTSCAGFTNIQYADTNPAWLATITAVKPVSATVHRPPFGFA